MRPLLEEPLTYVNRFFSDFRRPAVTLLLLLALIVTLQVLGAVLDTLNTIPLVGGVLKLVGMGYTVWFVSQNLLSVDRRQATWAKINEWKQQIVGQTQTWMQATPTSLRYFRLWTVIPGRKRPVLPRSLNRRQNRPPSPSCSPGWWALCRC
jgi:valyl-tRNA synthetase